MASERLHPLPDPDPPDDSAPDLAVVPDVEPARGDATAVVLALELGWRLAVLYAELEDPLHAVGEVEAVPACLPAVETMPNGDQLEVQVRAAASLAYRLKATSHGDEILALAGAVHATCGSRRESLAVRGRLRECHSKLIKELWFQHEAQGKAYELGTSLFDSWNRVHVARSADGPRRVKEWQDVFGPERIERIKVLLDDLQTQLSPTAVTVVKAHLDFWREAVDQHVKDDAAAPSEESIELLRAQTVIWRQLLTEAKQPEAFLKREQRRDLHRAFKQLVWRSFLRPLPIAVGLTVIAVIVCLLVGVIHAGPSAKGAIALLGAIGFSQASLTVIARDRIRDWTELLWNRALADVVFEATLLADDVFQWRETSVSCSLAQAGRRVIGRAAPALPTRPTAQL